MAPKRASTIKSSFKNKKNINNERKKSSHSAKSSSQSTAVEDDKDQNEETLKEFDMNMKYGPCIGISRLERWERASRLGLNPPEQVKTILENTAINPQCLWEGRI